MSITKHGLFLFGRGAVVATVAAVALTAIDPGVVMAATAVPAAKGLAADHGSSGNTDISAARRRHYSRGGNAAGLAAFAGIVGTIGAIAASQNRHDYYYEGGTPYGYGGTYGYGGGPYGYGGPAYYGNPYYGGYGRHGYDNSRGMTW